MISLLSKLGYTLDFNTQVWLKADCESIAYNDGDEVENRITSAIAHAKDVSLFSPELKKHCIDWPSLYHLSAGRANILRPFRDILPDADVLEIGSGCGAITRYLGECGANVLALEGTLRRAVVTRARTRDLDNVAVVCEQFHKFASSQKFDVITLIGVLEYANLFMPGESPVHNMLQQVKSMLKPEGRLIIAIENQLGLKYFAGAPEDHHGQPLYGIEGRYKEKQPTTYGRRTLKNYLHQVGFIENHFFVPFPDYKLPLSIITQRGFSNQEFDPGMLVTHGVRADPQLPPHLFFSPELVWPVVLKNELALDLANSFLIVAQTSKIKLPAPEVLAYHYSTYRSKVFCKETLFLQTKKGDIEVQCKLLESTTFQNIEDQELSHTFEKRADYIKGKLLSCDFIDIVIRDGWSVEEVGSFFKKYLSIVVSLISKNNPIKEIDIDTLLSGNSIDLTPLNIIIKENGEPHAIDQEWGWNNSISVGFLIFRSLLWLNNIISCYGKPESTVPNTLLGLFLALYKEMGFEIREDKIQSYYELEVLFQSKVAQDKVVIPHLSSSLRTSNLSHLINDYTNYIQNIENTLIEREHHIRNLEYVVADKNRHTENLEHTFEEKDHHIRNLEHMVAEKNLHIENLECIFEDKDHHIRNLEYLVADKNRHIGNLEHIFGEKENHIRNLEYLVEDKNRHIENLEHIFGEKENHIKNLERMVEDKDRHIGNLEYIFGEKDNHISNLERMVEDKDRHIGNLEYIFGEKDNHISNLERMVEDKDRHIENLEYMFAEKESHISNLEHMVADKDRHVENLEHIFAGQASHISSLEHIVVDKGRHIENLEYMFVEKDRHIENLEYMFVEKDRHIENLECMFAEKESHISSLESIVADKDKYIEHLEHRFGEKGNRIKSLEQMVVDKDKHIEHLENISLYKNRKILFLEQIINSFKKKKIVQFSLYIRKKIIRNPIKICSKSTFFDKKWYLDYYPDVRVSGLDPVIHYIKYGAAEKRDPGPNFSTRYYLEENPDVEKMGINPLVHYEIQKNFLIE